MKEASGNEKDHCKSHGKRERECLAVDSEHFEGKMGQQRLTLHSVMEFLVSCRIERQTCCLCARLVVSAHAFFLSEEWEALVAVMSSAKKLQSEVDRVLKAVTEGQEVFEEIWQKVHEASTSAQKEKFESELKTQIKKLQRLREQLKTWIAGDQVKDKQPLMEARKRIETDMERFKVCEKETKTKAYSKDGLAAAGTNDPETRAKMEAREWLDSCLDSLQTQKDALEAEIEVIRSRQKKGSKVTARETELDGQRERHNYHVERLELMLRLLDNDNLTYDDINSIRDDVDYYIQSNQDPDFQEDETIYDALNLDELDQEKGGLVQLSKKDKDAEKAQKEKEDAEREEARRREEVCFGPACTSLS